MVSTVLSVSSLLITFHHSLLEIGLFLHGAPRENCKRRRGEGVGEAEGGGRPTIKHLQRSRRSIHDIRLNEYMNSNESRPHVVLTSGPQGLSPGSA